MSVKQLRQGHPWVTLDGFSRRFPVQSPFIIGQDDRKMDVGVLLHDPRHKTVRGRLWSTQRPWVEQNFWPEFENRLFAARTRRAAVAGFISRDDRYWVFGEGDGLPGLMLLQLSDRWVLQFYALLWEEHRERIFAILKKVFPEIDAGKLWWQTRAEDGHGQKPPRPWMGEARQEVFPLREEGVTMLARLGDAYDYGLYADMAAVRHALHPVLEGQRRVLNLYSYTGAFSLQALKLGADHVVSVDLSPKYLGWLNENLAANPADFAARHRAIQAPVEDALKQLVREGQGFDVIITDPPSASSDGNKRVSALQAYEAQAENLRRLLAPGGSLVTFLNTHTVSANKFETHLRPLFSNLKIQRRFALTGDCPTVKGFPEGDYLKGMLWI
jgi:23S rRNA (cytosine1962-C5)-methyltransferase